MTHTVIQMTKCAAVIHWEQASPAPLEGAASTTKENKSEHKIPCCLLLNPFDY